MAVWERLWHLFSSGLQHAIQKVLTPIHRQLVAGVADPVEHSAGMILVQLQWIETWDYDRFLKPPSKFSSDPHAPRLVNQVEKGLLEKPIAVDQNQDQDSKASVS
jgi:hypothetical protein